MDPLKSKAPLSLNSILRILLWILPKLRNYHSLVKLILEFHRSFESAFRIGWGFRPLSPFLSARGFPRNHHNPLILLGISDSGIKIGSNDSIRSDSTRASSKKLNSCNFVIFLNTDSSRTTDQFHKPAWRATF